MLDQPISTLVAKGSPKTGTGCYSEVFRSLIPKTVVKHCRIANRDGWLYWAAWCMSRPTRASFMPNIHALHIDWGNNQAWALMEELEKAHDWFNICGCMSGNQMIQNGLTDALPTQGEEIFNTLQDIKKDVGCNQPFFLDAHSSNWMQRPDTGEVVLIDPFCATNIPMRENVERLLAGNEKVSFA